MEDRIAITKQFYSAFATSDRTFVEKHLAAAFIFSSPTDPHLDRQGYFERCWPGSGSVRDFTFIRIISSGDEVVVTYEAIGPNGTKGRNTEVLTFDDENTIVRAEVYFGWTIV